jgi:hypothetical protein
MLMSTYTYWDCMYAMIPLKFSMWDPRAMYCRVSMYVCMHACIQSEYVTANVRAPGMYICPYFLSSGMAHFGFEV